MDQQENSAPNRLRQAKARQNEALKAEICSLKTETRVLVGLKQTECARLRSKILERGANRALRLADRDIQARGALPGTPQLSDSAIGGASSPLRAALGPSLVAARAIGGGGGGGGARRDAHQQHVRGAAERADANPLPLTPISRNHVLRRDLQIAEQHLRRSNSAMDERLSLLQTRAGDVACAGGIGCAGDIASPGALQPAAQPQLQLQEEEQAPGDAHVEGQQQLEEPAEAAEAAAAAAAAEAAATPQPGNDVEEPLVCPLGHSFTEVAHLPLDIAVVARQRVREGWLGTDASYTEYEVQARGDAGAGGGGGGAACSTTTTVLRARYSQLRADHHALEASCGGAAVKGGPWFPAREPKLFVHHSDPAFVERRRAQLERYLRALAAGMATVQQLREALPCSSSKQQRSEQSSPAAEQRPAKRQRVAADQPVVRAQGVMSWLMVPFVEGSQPHRQAAL